MMAVCWPSQKLEDDNADGGNAADLTCPNTCPLAWGAAFA